MVEISGFGTIMTLVATTTFPVGLLITSAADDADFLELPVLKIADAAMGVNGDLITWSSANPLECSLNIIPNTPAEIGLNVLFQANRPSQGKSNQRDIITLSVLYPNMRPLMLSKGRMVGASPGRGIQSAGRLKTVTYNFVFQDVVSV